MRTFKDTRGKCWYDIVPKLAGQIDIAINYPGTIRAFHYHLQKTKWFFAVQGEFKVVLQSKESRKIIYLSQGEIIKIRPAIWHGYQVLGDQVGIMLEIADHKHNLKKPDDQRKPYDTFDRWKKEKK